MKSPMPPRLCGRPNNRYGKIAMRKNSAPSRFFKAFSLLAAVLAFLPAFSSCGKGVKFAPAPAGDQWGHPYVAGMKGVENLVFDGQGLMFVTGLDGTLYRVEPTKDPFQGRITDSIKLGSMCLGIAVAPDGSLYVAAENEKEKRRIFRVSRDFSVISPVSPFISGLNGMVADKAGNLYFAASNESPFEPSGRILKAVLGKDESFQNPEVFLEGAGLVNGLAFSPDEGTLYFTETLSGVFALNMATRKKEQIWKPSGWLPVVDDLAVALDGTVWVCYNSKEALLPIRDRKPAEVLHQVPEMGAPSSCRFGKGPGFRPDCLYVTEFGLKGRSFTKNGRGVWMFPVSAQ